MQKQELGSPRLNAIFISFLFSFFFLVLFLNNPISSSICKLPIRTQICNCTFKNSNKVSIIIISLIYDFTDKVEACECKILDTEPRIHLKYFSQDYRKRIMCGGFDLFAHYLFIHNAVTPGERGLHLGILGGICRPVLLIRPLFRTKNCLFHTRCHTWALKSIPVFYFIISWIRTPIKRQPVSKSLLGRRNGYFRRLTIPNSRPPGQSLYLFSAQNFTLWVGTYLNNLCKGASLPPTPPPHKDLSNTSQTLRQS